MQYQIQKLVLPSDEKHQDCRELFYRGDAGILDGDSLTLGFAQKCDFATYLNACSWRKWQKYTIAKRLSLHLRVDGKARIELVGYNYEAKTVVKKVYATEDFDGGTDGEFVFEFPENDEQMVGFLITALSEKVTISGGYFAVEVEEKKLNSPVLSIATTTFKKEPFIKKNVEKIRTELLDNDDDLARNTYLHVIDNGRTLSDKEIFGKHVTLHQNQNVGGSGGFARGMIESLEQKPKATHVLLMDDDILVLTESIRRTYNLLRLEKPEYRDYFINGAMLYYENPGVQHEDIGTIKWSGAGKPLKGKLNQAKLKNNLKNEQDWIVPHGAYGAWWFCCIPVSAIEKNGLPLPIFVRADDIEYAIRCQAKFITMNGIAVWHMGFDAKYNAALTYQGYRNNFMGAAFSATCSIDGIYRLWYNDYRTEMMRFHYDAAEILLDAIEDFMKGPDFLREPLGEKLMMEKSQKSDKLVPLDEIEGFDFAEMLGEVTTCPTMSLKTRMYLKLTWNGQKFSNNKNQSNGVILFNTGLQPMRVVGCNKLLAVNLMHMTGIVYEKDRKRFKEIEKRFKKVSKAFKKNVNSLVNTYGAAREEMVSMEFWKKYLDLS